MVSTQPRPPHAAPLAVGIDDDVPDVAGVAGTAVQRRAVEHQSAAHPGRDHHAQHGSRAAPGAVPVFPERHADAVAAEPDRHPRHRGGHPVAQRETAPAGMLIGLTVPASHVDGPRRADARPASTAPPARASASSISSATTAHTTSAP